MRITIGSLLHPGRNTEINGILFAASVRKFSGSFSDTPIKFYVPNNVEQISASTKTRLRDLDVTLVPVEIHPDAEFPFMEHAFAAAQAEKSAEGKSDLLAWLATNTLILREPNEFYLKSGKDLGFRPVHHRLIGSLFDEPLDSFWTEVYRQCKVTEDRVFPMTAHVDGEKIRPYFNAGILVSRPQTNIFQLWRDTFLRVHREKTFHEFYKRDRRYAIFIHQAILSGVILARLDPNRLQEFSRNYNYPMHLFDEDVTDHRPSSMDGLAVFRHEGFHIDPNWRNKIPASEELKQWISQQIG